MKFAFRFLFLFFAVCPSGLRAGDDVPVSYDQLPKAAQTMLQKHFPGKKVALAKMEKGFFKKSYDVILTTGEKLEFDSDGNWTEIKCRRSAVPPSLIPHPVREYVLRKHSGSHVCKMEKEDKKLEIQLSDKTKLKFSRNFKVKKK